MEHSTPNRPGWKPHYFFYSSIYRWPQKNDPRQFLDFFENFFGSNVRNCQFSTQGRYRFFYNLHHKFFDSNKIETSFIMSKALLEVLLFLLLLLEEVLGHVNNHVFNQISSFKHKPLFKILIFAMTFLVLDDVIDLEISRWRIEARYHTSKNHAKVIFFKKASCLKEDILLKTWFTWPSTSFNNNINNNFFCFNSMQLVLNFFLRC